MAAADKLAIGLFAQSTANLSLEKKIKANILPERPLEKVLKVECCGHNLNGLVGPWLVLAL